MCRGGGKRKFPAAIRSPETDRDGFLACEVGYRKSIRWFSAPFRVKWPFACEAAFLFFFKRRDRGRPTEEAETALSFPEESRGEGGTLIITRLGCRLIKTVITEASLLLGIMVPSGSCTKTCFPSYYFLRGGFPAPSSMFSLPPPFILLIGKEISNLNFLSRLVSLSFPSGGSISPGFRRRFFSRENSVTVLPETDRLA